MKIKDEKTNVMRILDQKKVKYNSYNYLKTGAISGMEVAKALDENPNLTFKTLVTVGKTNNHYVFLVPVNKELDLKKAAKAVNEKKYRNGKIKRTIITYWLYSWWMFSSWNEKEF